MLLHDGIVDERCRTIEKDSTGVRVIAGRVREYTWGDSIDHVRKEQEMIPQEIYDHVKNAHYQCHGARLQRSDKRYHLRLENRQVVATLFVDIRREELAGYEARGWETSRGTDPALLAELPQLPRRFPRAWKDIPLSRVPDSSSEEWECWDEF